MKKFVSSLTTQIPNWLAGISVILAILIGSFTTGMMQTGVTLISVSIFFICLIVELGISIMNLSHGMFELTHNKGAIIRSYVAIALGFVFNTALIYGAANANVFTYEQAFLFWLVYTGANAFRIFFGLTASSMIHNTKEALQTTIHFKQQQAELAQIETVAQVALNKQKNELNKLVIEGKKDIQRLPAHVKVAEEAGKIVGTFASAKETMKNAFANKYQENVGKPMENLRKPTENAENLPSLKSNYDIYEIQGIMYNEDGSISVRFIDSDILYKISNLKSLQSNLNMRKDPKNEKYDPAKAMFFSFVLEHLPIKSDTGSAIAVITKEKIDGFLAKQNEEVEC